MPMKVVLDVENEELLFDLVQDSRFTVHGFASVDGCLGTSAAIESGAAAWVHSRETATGGLRVSTQFFWVNNPLLAQYQGSNAFTTSANSYGGISTDGVYLRPDKATVNGSGVSTAEPSSTGTGCGGSSTGGDSGSTGGAGGSGTQGSTGGDSGSNGDGGTSGNGGTSGTGGSGSSTGSETGGGSQSGGSGSGSGSQSGGSGSGGDDSMLGGE